MQNSVLQWLSVKLLERPLQPRELLTARKVVYIVLIIVLFTASFFWRRGAGGRAAVQLAIRQDSRGDVELSGELIRLSLTGCAASSPASCGTRRSRSRRRTSGASWS